LVTFVVLTAAAVAIVDGAIVDGAIVAQPKMTVKNVES